MKNTDWFVASALVFLGVLSRTVLHLGPNVEIITALSLAANWLLSGQRPKLAIPLAIMVGSDLLIGNTGIALFTWSGMCLPYLLTRLLRKKKLPSFMTYCGLGLTSVLGFFLWTNFGVVVVSDIYSKDLAGLLLSYVNGLPFLTNQLAANLVSLTVTYLVLRYRNLGSDTIRALVSNQDIIHTNSYGEITTSKSNRERQPALSEPGIKRVWP